MGEYFLFGLSMILCGLLLGEARFGGRISSHWHGIRKGRPLVRIWSEEQPRDNQLPPPPPPEEPPGSGLPEGDGKPAPLQPRPGHHLVAAKALPPSDDVYLLPRD